MNRPMAEGNPSMFLKTVLTILVVLSAAFPSFAADDRSGDVGQRMEILHADHARVVYEPGGLASAEDLAELYAEVKAKTEELFGWTFHPKATLVIVRDRQRFLSMADNPITVAYAVPSQNTIVMDYSTTASRPFSLETTLMHEFCHLLLHDRIPGIPRWLDEGLCQWASGGLDEIIFSQDQARAALNRAAVSDGFIPFEDLESGFPYAESPRVLAYEQSRNFVSYLARRFDPENLRAVLRGMENGETFETASLRIYGLSFERLEEDWRASVRTEWPWLAFLGNNVYTFLFVAAALATVIGFLRFLWRKRNYRDEYWDAEEESEENRNYDFNDYYDYYDDDLDEYDDDLDEYDDYDR
jgi:hypothetical protein